MLDTLKRLRNYRVILASFLVSIPIILRLVSGEWRKSISDYAYADNPAILPILLTLGAMVFMLDNVANKGKWYSSVLGVALIGIGLTPHNDFTILHYSFATTFFIGSVIVMIVFSSSKQRYIKILLGAVAIIGLAISILSNNVSLLVGEWIALFPISVHYIGEGLKRFD